MASGTVLQTQRKKEAQKPSCSTCRYYQAPLCRRFPPTPYPGWQFAKWVTIGTQDFDWCGEWRAKA